MVKKVVSVFVELSDDRQKSVTTWEVEIGLQFKASLSKNKKSRSFFKNKVCMCLTFVIPPSWEVEIGGPQSESAQAKNVKPYLKINSIKKQLGMWLK
jgi:hypothetical protein